MKGTFLRTGAPRIAAAFFRNRKGGLDKWPYLPDTLQGPLSPHIGHQLSRHYDKYIYFPYRCQ